VSRNNKLEGTKCIRHAMTTRAPGPTAQSAHLDGTKQTRSDYINVNTIRKLCMCKTYNDIIQKGLVNSKRPEFVEVQTPDPLQYTTYLGNTPGKSGKIHKLHKLVGH
jgi:hypothetical protein